MDVQGFVEDLRNPTPPSRLQKEVQEGHLSPWVTLWGLVEDCPWRSVEGRHLPFY